MIFKHNILGNMRGEVDNIKDNIRENIERNLNSNIEYNIWDNIRWNIGDNIGWNINVPIKQVLKNGEYWRDH